MEQLVHDYLYIDFIPLETTNFVNYRVISLSIDWCLMQLSIWWEVGFLKSALKEIKICAESAVLVVVEIREINGWLGFLAIVSCRLFMS